MPRVTADYVPAYRLHKSSGQAIVTLSTRDYLLGVFGSPTSKAKYHELIARWISNGRKPLDTSPSPVHPIIAGSAAPKLTVSQLIDAHLRYAFTYYVDEEGAPTTEVRNYEAATAPLRELFGPTPADDFSPTKLKALRTRMVAKGKTPQPLMIVETNTPKSDASFCAKLREKAEAALAGHGDPALFPIIWAAPEDARTDDPAAWKLANPLLGVTMSEDVVRAKCVEAMKDPQEEEDFRREYLGIRPTKGAGRWIDLKVWDAATVDFNARDRAGDALYVGLDLSLGDDLCAAAYVWPTPNRFFVGSRFWMPKRTAKKYEAKLGVPFEQWAEAGDITLIDEPTISVAVHHRISAEIAAMNNVTPIRAVCVDRAYSGQTLANLRAAGLPCMLIGQGWGVKDGTEEIDRRLTEGSISIARNAVLRWCAENATLKTDDRGNRWPVKPNAKGTYAGKRGLKIDGITALVTALTEAHNFTHPVAGKNWQGEICLMSRTPDPSGPSSTTFLQSPVM